MSNNSAIYCGHSNECVSVCKCGIDCYCATRACKSQYFPKPSLDKQALDGQAAQLRRSSFWGNSEAWKRHEQYISELHGIIFYLVGEVKELKEGLMELESTTDHLSSHIDFYNKG
jgi:hypothetical protein